MKPDAKTQCELYYDSHCVFYIRRNEKMEAIIYTSNSGSTAKYAEMLSHELHLPTYNLKGAKQKVPAGAEVIYLGWIMAVNKGFDIINKTQ